MKVRMETKTERACVWKKTNLVTIRIVWTETPPCTGTFFTQCINEIFKESVVQLKSNFVITM